jgi:O-antigen/teichoic acid export membrane protein
MIYAAASGLSAVLALVLTRLLWHMLSREDFGLWSLIDPILLPAASLVLFGVENAIVKQLGIDGLSLRQVSGVLLAGTLPVTGACLLLIGIIAHSVFRLGWTDALLLTLAGEALLLMLQTAYRAAGQVGGFAALLLSRNLLYILLLVGLWAGRGMQTLPINLAFYARGLCVILVGLVALACLRPLLRLNHRRYFDALRYGSPLLLASFIFALNDSTDRWFLADNAGVAAVGIYALHLKLAAILAQAIVIPFGLWYPTERFRRLGVTGEGHRFFISTAAVLAVVCMYCSGLVWLARDLLLAWIAPGAAASPLILGCCLAAVISLALSQALNVGLLLPGHTFKNAICSLCAVVGTALAASVLVRLAGVDGAAISRLFGAVVMTGVTAVLSQRVCRVAFPFIAMLIYFAASAGALVAINLLLGQGLAEPLAGGPHGLGALAVAIPAWTAVTAIFAALFLSRLWGTSHALRFRTASQAENEVA